MSDFTPGPWFIQQEQNPTTHSSGRSETLAVHDAHGERVALPATLPNARLIAAAPELYEAALTVFNGLNDRIDAACLAGDSVPVFAGIAELSDALNKARGEA